LLFCCLSLRLGKLDRLLYNLVHYVWCRILRSVDGLSRIFPLAYRLQGAVVFSRRGVVKDCGCACEKCVDQVEHQHAVPVSKASTVQVSEPELGYSLETEAIRRPKAGSGTPGSALVHDRSPCGCTGVGEGMRRPTLHAWDVQVACQPKTTDASPGIKRPGIYGCYMYS
jgi:hypothetical protein